MKRLLGLLFLLITFSELFAVEENVNIGILALRGKENTYAKWNATALYLSDKIPGYRFEIVPLDFSEIDLALANREVDFLLANSSIYVEMEFRHQIGRIATLKRKTPHAEAVSIFGGVIFTRNDHTDIHSILDLKNKHFAAVDHTSLGGWHMAWRKMKQMGFDPERQLKTLSFSGTHDQVVYDVLNGKADAGTVRTGVLESMARENKINLGDIRILEPEYCDGLNLLNSTACYPEWPIAKLRNTSDRLASDVAIALIGMMPDEPAAKAATIYGWSIPYNYQSVHDLRRELELSPYDVKPEITLTEVLNKYGYVIVLALLIMILSIGATVWILGLNRKLKTSEGIARQNYEELKKLQTQLVESEKMASLGGLVAGVSHEINTPVGIALTGVTHLLDELKELMKKYKKEEMSEEDFTGFISLTQELGHSIEVNLNRAANLTRSFKQVAVDQSSEEMREFSVREYVEEILTSLHNRIKKTKHHIILEIDPELRIRNYPGAFSQVITNLILNSLIHAYEEGDEGHISIALRRQEGVLILSYRDDGKGIPKENLKKIFDPFFTTNREQGGSGLGMNIIYNIITQKLKGNITCHSQVGEGVEFIITMPCLTENRL